MQVGAGFGAGRIEVNVADVPQKTSDLLRRKNFMRDQSEQQRLANMEGSDRRGKRIVRQLGYSLRGFSAFGKRTIKSASKSK